MVTNKKGIDLITFYEGLELKAYRCTSNILTIGFGHTKDVKEGMVITEKRAIELLKEDLNIFEKQIESLNLDITENQFSALVSLCFNIGFGNLKGSTLIKIISENPYDTTKIQKKDFTGNVIQFLDGIEELNIIDYNFRRWCNSNGKATLGLYNRRMAEFNLYCDA